jgi:DNA-binding transcriptional MerR regulator/effector-binding domain-containing protein
LLLDRESQALYGQLTLPRESVHTLSMRTELTIGEFSRASHLSVKTLRYYHQAGLLEPSFVSASNGYRHYSEEQIPTAQVIRRLRDLEMPVADVKAVLTATDAQVRNTLIATHLDRLEDQLASTSEAVSSLRNLIDRPQTPLNVEHRTVASTPAVAIQAVVDREDVLTWWRGALGELHAFVAAQGLRRTGSSGGLYASELFQHDRGEATVFIPVDGHVRSVGRVEPFVVPAAELAVIVHRGSLADIDLTYGNLGSYASRHELSVAGPLREFYLRDSRDTDDPDAWVTEIGWPIFRADPKR